MTILLPYLGGAGVGAILTISLMRAPNDSLDGVLHWAALNLGHSVWIFTVVVVLFVANLASLREQLGKGGDFRAVSRLDQVSDVWIHVFVGTGVIWTAVGMRSALSSTLAVPADIGDDAAQVLARLVDGGILLALTTTIVGAVGGYMMRLTKTGWLGAALSEFYDRHERREMTELMMRLESIENAIIGNGNVPATAEPDRAA